MNFFSRIILNITGVYKDKHVQYLKTLMNVIYKAVNLERFLKLHIF